MALPDLLIEAVARLCYRVADGPADRGRRELVAKPADGTGAVLVEFYDPDDFDGRERAALRLAKAAGVDLEDG